MENILIPRNVEYNGRCFDMICLKSQPLYAPSTKAQRSVTKRYIHQKMPSKMASTQKVFLHRWFWLHDACHLIGRICADGLYEILSLLTFPVIRHVWKGVRWMSPLYHANLIKITRGNIRWNLTCPKMYTVQNKLVSNSTLCELTFYNLGFFVTYKHILSNCS